MGNVDTRKNVILLFENYDDSSKKLHESFKMAKKEYKTLVINDDGFLPDDAETIYECYLGDFKKSKKIPLKIKEKNRPQNIYD